MSAHLYSKKISYISVPKVACTSIKSYFFEYENGFPFKPMRINEKRWGVHNAYAGVEFEDLPHKRIANHAFYAVVREPVARFLSCYSNRVQHHRELAPKFIKPRFQKVGLKPNPTIHEFIERLEEYRTTSRSVGWHSRPLTASLGTDIKRYDRIYKFKELGEFVTDMNKRLGHNGTLPHLQSGGKKIKADVLSKAEIQKIQDHYASDYEFFSDYF